MPISRLNCFVPYKDEAKMNKAQLFIAAFVGLVFTFMQFIFFLGVIFAQDEYTRTMSVFCFSLTCVVIGMFIKDLRS